MKTISMVLANLIFIQTAFAGTAISNTQPRGEAVRYIATVGPGSTGGGEPVSQEVRGIVSSLPSILRSKGLQYFPEVHITDLERRTQDGILVELSPSRIMVNGSPKACQYDRDRNLIQVDPVQWQILSLQPNTEVRKRALVFHEVLGLMGLEKNNDYTISNRLVAAEFLSSIGIKGTTDQILPTNAEDTQVIYWRVSDQGRISFFYCMDRSKISSCVGLGSRSYTAQDLDGKYRQIYADYEKAQWNVTKMKMIGYGVIAGGVVLVGSAFVVALPILWMAGVIAGVSAVPILAAAVPEREHARDEVGAQLRNTKQAAYLKAGVSPKADFREYANVLQQFLLSIDAPAGLAPELPASLN